MTSGQGAVGMGVVAGAGACWQGAAGTPEHTLYRHAACSGTVITAGAGHPSQQRVQGRQQATDISQAAAGWQAMPVCTSAAPRVHPVGAGSG